MMLASLEWEYRFLKNVVLAKERGDDDDDDDDRKRAEWDQLLFEDMTYHPLRVPVTYSKFG